MISAMFSKFTRPGEEYVSLDGLTSFLVSSDNAAVVDDSDQDMTRPLCEYYIASSHNVRPRRSLISSPPVLTINSPPNRLI